jgi:hypothetical protein
MSTLNSFVFFKGRAESDRERGGIWFARFKMIEAEKSSSGQSADCEILSAAF